MERCSGKSMIRFANVRTFAVLVLMQASFAGCFLLQRSAPPERQYALEYPSPAFGERVRLDQAIRVDRFTTAEEFTDASMVYSPSPLERDIYNYSWWEAAPGGMITDFLLRDFRNSGLYRAVFSYRDDFDTRFHLGGRVDDFLEIDGPDGPKAVVALTATLLDSAVKSVMFQKDYRFTAPMKDRTPQALAGAMSEAVGNLSGALQADVYDAVRNAGRPVEEAPSPAP